MAKTQKQKLDEVYQAVVGIEGNPDCNGIVGDTKEIVDHLTTLNGQVAKNTMFRKIGTWVAATAGGAGILFVIGIMTGQIEIQFVGSLFHYMCGILTIGG